MKRPVRRYEEKFEAMDLAAGIYPSRQLPRMRYNKADFMEYLNLMDALEDDLLLELMQEGEFPESHSA